MNNINYGTDLNFNGFFEFFGAIAIILVGVMIVIGIICIISHIFGSIGIMRISNRLKEGPSWVAWIPLFNTYLLVKIGISSTMAWVALVLVILILFGSTISPLALTALLVLSFIALYKIYLKFSTKANVMTVLTVLSFGILSPFFLFAIRNNEIIGEEIKEEPKEVEVENKIEE